MHWFLLQLQNTASFPIVTNERILFRFTFEVFNATVAVSKLRITLMTTELAENIDWVGYVDWNVRDFHSFDTSRGATYNSYLIRDNKIAVIDSVKGLYASRLLQHLAEKTELANIDYVVCNHAEPDHAGGLIHLMANLPNAVLLCNAKCRETLAAYFDISNWKIQVVSPDDKISLGSRTLNFVNTPMVHWPESMFTYIPEEQLLFSMDAFGQHLATSERFDDQYDLATVLAEAKSYYANIVTPYSKQVLRTLEVAAKIPIKMIAPSHGLIWRTNIPKIVEAYQDWAGGKYAPKVLILFDSMWDSTAQMAEAILDGAVQESDNVDVQLMHVRRTALTRIAAEMLDAAAVALGSSTLNLQIMPQMASVTTYVRGLKFTSKTAIAFGSYGWAHAGSDQLDRWIEETGWTRLSQPIDSKFRPTHDILEKCRNAGRQLAQAALEKK
ncbi:MAG: flavodoxin domain-containing protein [Planctomycetaceae bacterium]|nr:flavodoxin domain-containing protein [Planctomycetaceae bacterium]